jgi:hypothetical protein
VDGNVDNDGVPDIEEQGPAGNDPNYDGNDDGVADRLQNNVTSLYTYDGRNYVTIESPAGTSISNGKTVDNPAPTNAPSDVSFSEILLLGLIMISLSVPKLPTKPEK